MQETGCKLEPAEVKAAEWRTLSLAPVTMLTGSAGHTVPAESSSNREEFATCVHISSVAPSNIKAKSR